MSIIAEPTEGVSTPPASTHPAEMAEVRPGAHPGETVCEGCIHGPACRVIPCVDCGNSWHLLGLIGKPPFVCPRCEDKRAGLAQPEPHPCGHAEQTTGCGGCDPGAIEFVITDEGERRPFNPAADMSTSPGQGDGEAGA